MGETSLGQPVGMVREGSGRGLAGGTNNVGRKVKRLNPKSSNHKKTSCSFFSVFPFYCILGEDGC